MRTKGKVNTIDGPGKKFRSAFSLLLKGIGHHLNCLSRICFNYITPSTYNKVQVKRLRARFCPRLRSFCRRHAAVKASRLHCCSKENGKRKTFRSSSSRACGPPVNYEKSGRAGVLPARRSAQAGKPVPPELFRPDQPQGINLTMVMH
jgi:hypothetical protein